MLERNTMKNITIALPEIYVDAIENLSQMGLFPSRSEAIRNAIRNFLKKEHTNKQKILFLGRCEMK